MSQFHQALLFGGIYVLSCMMPTLGPRKSYALLRMWIQFSMFIGGVGVGGFIAMLFNASFSLSSSLAAVAGLLHWCHYRLNVRHIIG